MSGEALDSEEVVDQGHGPKQYSTFYLGDRLYGIDVMQVQEITKALPMTPVPLSPDFVHGLINLRGQISTAIGLKELFDLKLETEDDPMNVVCDINGLLVSFLVDRIGDVMELEVDSFEPSPDTIPANVRKFMKGVYKTPGQILSIIDIEKVSSSVNAQEAG